MSRRDILADVLAELERERFTAPPRSRRTNPRRPDAPDPVTAEQAAQNRAELVASLDRDATTLAWLDARKRGAA